MHSSPGRVTALVPTFNGELFLEETLISLAAQDYSNLRVLISDDCSDDGTWEICQRFTKKDFRFLAVRQESCLGWMGNCNWLLEMVEGNFAFFAPQDDLFDRTYVSELMKCLNQTPEAVLAFANLANFERSLSGRGEPYLQFSGDALSGRLRQRTVACILWQEWIAFRGVARVQDMKAAGLLKACNAGEFAADVRWLFRLVLQGPFAHVNKTLYWKRRHPANLSSSWSYTSRAWRNHTLAYVPHILSSKIGVMNQCFLIVTALFRAWSYFLPKRFHKKLVQLWKQSVKSETPRSK